MGAIDGDDDGAGAGSAADAEMRVTAALRERVLVQLRGTPRVPLSRTGWPLASLLSDHGEVAATRPMWSAPGDTTWCEVLDVSPRDAFDQVIEHIRKQVAR
jgi:hypothetical protein